MTQQQPMHGKSLHSARSGKAGRAQQATWMGSTQAPLQCQVPRL
jgi:hypothetical protein